MDVVVGLYLLQNNLKGTLVNKISNLGLIKMLSFDFNRLMGRVLAGLGNLQKLRECVCCVWDVWIIPCCCSCVELICVVACVLVCFQTQDI